MIIPIGDENIADGARPVFSYLFLFLNVVIFLYELTLSNPEMEIFLDRYATIPVYTMSGQSLYTLLSSMFLHGGIGHLIGNMLFLWIFADNVEAVMGNFRFLLFYLAGGIIASLAHVWMNSGSSIPSLGASGAISAVLGAYIIMFPRSKIKMVFLLFFITFYISAFFFIGFWFLEQFLSVYAESGQTGASSQGVAWWAHIGGFVFGVIFGVKYRKSARQFTLA